VDIFLHAFLGYMVILDPIGAMLIFNALSEGGTKAYKRSMALRSVAISVVLICLFGFFGEALLNKLGIQIESFRVAGGLLIFYTAFHMIVKPDAPRSAGTAIAEKEDISVFPMAIPLLAGPGCLTLTILLFSDAKNAASSEHIFYLLAAIGVVYFLTLVILLFSSTIEKLIGKTVNNILKRLLGVLLAALAIQFIVDGIKGLIASS